MNKAVLLLKLSDKSLQGNRLINQKSFSEIMKNLRIIYALNRDRLPLALHGEKNLSM